MVMLKMKHASMPPMKLLSLVKEGLGSHLEVIFRWGFLVAQLAASQVRLVIQPVLRLASQRLRLLQAWFTSWMLTIVRQSGMTQSKTARVYAKSKTSKRGFMKSTEFQICHLTKSERGDLTIRSSLYGIWTALTLGIPLAKIFVNGSYLLPAIIICVHLLVIRWKLKCDLVFFSNTEWAKAEGVNIKDLGHNWLGRVVVRDSKGNQSF